MILTDAVDGSSHVRLVRNAALSAFAIGILGVSRLAYNIIAGRRFGPAALGEATLAINASMFASLAVSGGWQTSIARYAAQALGAGSRGEAAWLYRRMRGHNAAGGLVVAVGTWAALRYAPGIELPARDAMIAGVIVFVYNEYTFLKAALYGFGRVAPYLRIETASSLALIAALGVVAAIDSRPLLLAPVGVAYAMFAIVASLQLRGAGAQPSPLDPARWREVKRFTALAIIGTLASAGFLNLTPVFAGRYDTAAELGRFSAALALVIPVYFVPRALALALFPSIAFRFGQQRIDDVRTQLRDAGSALAIILLLPVAIAAVAAPFLLRIIFGAAFARGGAILAVMMGATYISVVQIPYVTALSGTERRWYKVPVLASVVGFVVGLVLWTTLGAREGAPGVAWGYLIGSIPQAAIPIVFASRVFRIQVVSLFVRASIVWAVAIAAILVRSAFSLAAAAAEAAIVVVAFGVLFGGDTVQLVRDARRRLAARSAG